MSRKKTEKRVNEVVQFSKQQSVAQQTHHNLLCNNMKVGDFTVELVAADTKQPFKEHSAPDGQVYAEVEPDVDYFIALRSDVGGVKMSFAVDGLSLGYSSNFTTPIKAAVYKGSWETKGCRGSQEVTRALRFSKTRQEVGVKPNTLTGKIEVTVSELG